MQNLASLTNAQLDELEAQSLMNCTWALNRSSRSSYATARATHDAILAELNRRAA